MDELDRVAGAPISWGICEVPGWGAMLPVDRVLSEMAALDLHATELGAPGFLPDTSAEMKAVLDAHDMRLVAAFVPLVLHDAGAAVATADAARRWADLLAAVGADVFVSAAIVDEAWAPRRPLDIAEWAHLVTMLGALDDITAAAGVRHVLHPHHGTLVETTDDVARVLAASDVQWCLDTGHLTIGGSDPVEFARQHSERVGHVHLKDVDGAIVPHLQSGELTLMEAVQQGLFRPLGRGDVAIDEVVTHLECSGYQGWYVLEQDTAITATIPPDGAGPVLDVRESVEYLRRLLGRVSSS